MQQPSESEIQRELEALRDIRRRSSTQGALVLDPDLPTQPPSPSSLHATQASIWTAGSPTSAASSSSVVSDTVDEDAPVNDPSHLFWVPAQLHPEINPTEFRNFLKEHARAPQDGTGTVLSRMNSASSGLGRKRSMLSRQYKPRENDGVEDEQVVPIRRNKSIFDQGGPQLTISDLQKLDQLAEEASKSDDPTRLRSLLRRSLSLNVSPSSVIDEIDSIPDPGEDADAPIIVPRPNQILRRAARTKIRKPNLSGDGGGHRFGPSNRRRSGRAMTDDGHIASDVSSSDHGEKRSDELEEEYTGDRRLTFSEETSIYDAYATDEPEAIKPVSPPPVPLVIKLPAPEPENPPELQFLPAEPAQASTLEPGSLVPLLHQPQPQRHLSPPADQVSHLPSRTPSPEIPATPPAVNDLRRIPSASSEATSFRTASPSPSEVRKDKEKEKKGLLTKWGGKSSKKSTKDQKDSGFFGSIFGGGKKKQEEQQTQPFSPGGSGRAAAAALLGESKSSKAYQAPPSPQLANAFARYPIHVERAVYRLSHIKLANPRRPLYEQVLISNLMFWYLGVINRSPQGAGQNQSPQAASQTSAPSPSVDVNQPVLDNISRHSSTELDRQDAQKEREDKEAVDKDKLPREREVEKVDQRKEARRGGLTKATPPGNGSGRRAETPVRGPQYGLQHQVIEQEYEAGFASGPVPIVRTSSAPPPVMVQIPSGFSGTYSPRGQQLAQPQPHKQPVIAPQVPHSQVPRHMQTHGQHHHNQHAHQHHPNQPQAQASHSTTNRAVPPDSTGSPRPASPGRLPVNLPPGAMPPFDNSWSQSNVRGSSAPPRMASPPQKPDVGLYNSRPHLNRSPPSHGHPVQDGTGSPSPGARVPTRSLSAIAGPVPQTPAGQQNGLRKKAASAIAAPSDWNVRHREPALQVTGGEEEDVPLALWQQQQRRR